MEHFNFQPKSSIISIDDWQSYQKDGRQFLKTAVGAYKKEKSTFSADSIYNIVAMAIEKYIMAFLMKNGDLAENHTMGDLAYALHRHMEIPEELIEKLQKLDSFQEICDIETYKITKPNSEELAMIIATGIEVEEFFTPLLNP